MIQRFRALRAFDDPGWRRTFFICVSIAFVLHCLAAVFSVGFYHTDEHFQVLEFLNYKLGRSTGSELAIEFGQRLRSWFQPGMDYVFARGMQTLGISSPFTWAFFFRLFSAVLGWISLATLSVLSYSWFDDKRLRRIALILVASLWYLPAFHARHSSESLSSSVFYIAASLLFIFTEAESLLYYFGIGLLLGAAFLFRFQVAFLIIGALGYFWLHCRPPLSRVLVIKVGILAMIGIGVCIDHWGYGEWTFTPWNYFHYNLVLGHVADVDTQPVWDFFTKSLTETFPALGFLTLCSFVLGWIFRPFHLLTAITFPLYLVHSLIGHKELRFIWPITDAGPFLILLALTARHRAGQAWNHIWWSKSGTITRRVLFGINLIALLPTTLLPCWPPARLFAQIYEIKQNELPHSSMVILYKDKNPFEILWIPLCYYRPDDTSSSQIDSFATLNEKIISAKEPVWYFQVGFDLPADAGLARERCTLVAQSMPEPVLWIVRWPPLAPITRRVTNWTLYRCQ